MVEVKAEVWHRGKAKPLTDTGQEGNTNGTGAQSSLDVRQSSYTLGHYFLLYNRDGRTNITSSMSSCT